MIFFHIESKSKIKLFFWRGGVWRGEGAGVGVRWMDGRTGPNQFAPSTSSKLGA